MECLSCQALTVRLACRYNKIAVGAILRERCSTCRLVRAHLVKRLIKTNGKAVEHKRQTHPVFCCMPALFTHFVSNVD
jgi:hypothetical protein